MMKLFHPSMSFENDSDYRKLENFDNSSMGRSDQLQMNQEAPSAQVMPKQKNNAPSNSGFPQSESDQIMQTYANELEKR